MLGTEKEEEAMAKMPKKTKEVFAYVKDCARKMRTVTYGEIAQALKMGRGQAVRYALGYIRDEVCERRHLPWLNAIVVNGREWYPGDSFLPAKVRFNSSNKHLLWRGVVVQVFTFNWDPVEL
jgi:alkylated DNA nucleotide flippase Atl1